MKKGVRQHFRRARQASFVWLAVTFDNWKKIVGGIVATVTFFGMLVTGIVWLDGRWDQRALAGDITDVKGQLNYQTNELKLGQAKQRLDAAQTRLLEFRLRPQTERLSAIGQQLQQDLETKVAEAKKDALFYEEALRRQQREAERQKK